MLVSGPQPKRDPYKVLGLEKTATQEQIAKAYRAKARKTHPDMGGSQEDFLEVQKAYDTLSDESKKAAFDRRQSGDQRGSTEAPGADYTWEEAYETINDIRRKMAAEAAARMADRAAKETERRIREVQIRATRAAWKAACLLGIVATETLAAVLRGYGILPHVGVATNSHLILGSFASTSRFLAAMTSPANGASMLLVIAFLAGYAYLLSYPWRRRLRSPAPVKKSELWAYLGVIFVAAVLSKSIIPSAGSLVFMALSWYAWSRHIAARERGGTSWLDQIREKISPLMTKLRPHKNKEVK